ncbi:respiratory nitrate reductase 1 subunit beta [Salmonella enterica subsp. arizonae]|uniref:Respiratory nitrate reductase 1 subunit beta n=1 Tax=Salmonella enterica subsp. arizonae TaxID=59203 RepID=A0A379S274_SALER|nr:respiratory nitrate reductase 1 subunit beta [Salmonella enterica subsp. arizonae]
MFLDPNDPAVIEQALKDGVPQSVIDAAQQSPVYKMAMDWKLALPLHPEYRTLPMVWYVPPLSPIQSAADAGELGSNGILPNVDSLRIPVQYLAKSADRRRYPAGTVGAETDAGDAPLQTCGNRGR